MSPQTALIVTLIENALIGAVFLLYPRITRKGLLFGVYVGEETFDGETARAITRSWYRRMCAALAASVLLGAGLALWSSEPFAIVVPVNLLVVAFLGLYLWAYRRARALAPAGPPPAAVAPLVVTPGGGAVLPLLAIAVGLACGVFSLAHSWVHYPELPDSVPTHFGISGEPDAWRHKSLATVMMLPAMVLVMGVGLGGIAWFTAHAKRALRRSSRPHSLAAQLRFRAAMTRFLTVVALLATAMLTTLSINVVRVGLGRATGLGKGQMILTGVLLVYALGGTIYLALRYGQGGARLEAADAAAPLTNGLADNRNWVLGMFYVNRDDPSFLVERRFGLGYTINLGNPKAVVLFGLFLAAIIGLAIVGVVSN